MANLKKDRRKDKRYVNNVRKKLKVGMYFVDCRLHPSVIIGREVYERYWNDDIESTSLIDGSPGSCSLMHCGPEPVSKAEAEYRVAFWKEHGYWVYCEKYYGKDQADYWKFIDEKWKFSEGNQRKEF